mgnify:CR=1 FL=1
MKRRGFTLVELVVVLSLLAVTVPLVFSALRVMEQDTRRGLAQVDAAQTARDVGDLLRMDLRTMNWQTADTLVLVGPPPCSKVQYDIISDGILQRRAEGTPACAQVNPVARHVKALRRVHSGVELVTGHAVGDGPPMETHFRLSWPEKPL